MTNKLWLFGMILGIPIFAFIMGTHIQAQFNSELRSEIRQHYPDADPEKVASFMVELLCKDSKLSIKELCETNANPTFMRNAALGSAGAGLALLLIIYLGGVSARNSRKMLLSSLTSQNTQASD